MNLKIELTIIMLRLSNKRKELQRKVKQKIWQNKILIILNWNNSNLKKNQKEQQKRKEETENILMKKC